MVKTGYKGEYASVLKDYRDRANQSSSSVGSYRL